MLNIIIVNWEREDDTMECLQSIEEHMPNIDEYRVFLIDNGSKEGINEIKKANYPFFIKIIENNENKGFTGGNNVGITESLKYDSNYTMLLNNDTVLVDDSIQRAIDELSINNDFGIVGLVNYFPDGVEIWQAGFILELVKGKKKAIYPCIPSAKKLIEVDYVPGSSLIFRTEIIDTIGLLDENYFAYWEEVDLCFNAKKKDYKIGFLNNSKIIHKVKKTTNNKLHFYLTIRNGLYFYRKNTNAMQFILFFILLNLKFILKKVAMKEKNSFSLFYIAMSDYFKNNLGKGSINNI